MGTGPVGVFSMELGGPGATRVDHPSRTDRGDGRCGGHTLHRSRLIRYPDAPRNRSTRDEPAWDGVGTGFSHTVEFSRNVAGLLFGDSLAVPASRPVAGAAGTVPRASRDRQRLPTCPERTPCGVLLATSAPSHRSAAPHPDCLGVGTATESRRRNSCWRSATSCLPLPTPRGVVPERSSVLKNFPACSLKTVAPAATACQLTDASDGNGSSVPSTQPKCRSGTPW